MSEKSFDIESLLRFSPPKFLCAKCYGIITSELFNSLILRICPICRVKYLATKSYSDVSEYLESEGLKIQFSNLIEHCKELANISNSAKEYLKSPNKEDIYPPYPPIRALFKSLQNAKQFIHFITYGISELFLGALKLTAQRIDIRGIVSNPSNYIIDELKNYPDEAPYLDIKICKRKDELKKSKSIPHNKLIIIDGLMAFKGTANLQHLAWRNSIEGHDEIVVVTDVTEVIDLNNLYFSRLWSKLSGIEDEMEMELSRFPF